jgi:iron complex outermembrane recepter protein
MKKCLLTLVVLAGFTPAFINAQNAVATPEIDSLAVKDTSIYKSLFTDEVIVQSTRAGSNTPTTFSEVSKEDLQYINLAQDLPFLLQREASVVATSDAGAGVGYTSMRIRGSDMSRINFTINGIAYNDPESQGVFLVNMPDFASSINNIQIQRGVGTSTNGGSAFGASVNINTNKLEKDAYAEVSSSLGSFNTFKNTLNLGSGLLNDRFTFDARLSRITSDGYIDRASSDMWSYYLSAGYYYNKTIFRFNHFSGKQITYQAWNGIDAATLETDRTFNPSGTDYGARETPYDNEIDNYKQDHWQAFLSQQLSENWTANFGVHLTKGKGYFEQYKVRGRFSSYGLPNAIIGGDTIARTDLIRRRWLDNDFYGATYSFNYDKNEKMQFILGGAWNQYDGDHFGEVIWAQYATNHDIRERYYDNNGLKTDFNTYAKLTYYPTEKLLLFGDLQYRRVSYTIDGINNDLRPIFEDVDYNFFNPKFGATYLINKQSQVYASFAVANREPSRRDFIDADPGETPLHETLYNVETGYRLQKEKYSFSSNYYLMQYRNQLVLNGAVNDVGTSVRENVADSYRTGIETEVSYRPIKQINFNGNVTWSINEIKEFTDTDWSGNETRYTNSKISYSPQWIGALNLDVNPWKGLSIGIINKFVGEQFLDNTSRNTLKLDRYFQSDLRLSYLAKTDVVKEIEFTLLINNITNQLYSSNGYVYYDQPFFFPQAGINFLAGLRCRF